ncbi:hypothetical protein GDO81_005236 [Engystomops pustulosus]|uniref:Uncharacterized protein n=1 Tax=Engystomops pustulosus TaxID=76066 RepID=A0AAV7CPI1_ENGPU|nr:hypothetical protein GDO81_005236 [Engystomops pustulosus]
MCCFVNVAKQKMMCGISVTFYTVRIVYTHTQIMTIYKRRIEEIFFREMAKNTIFLYILLYYCILFWVRYMQCLKSLLPFKQSDGK